MHNQPTPTAHQRRERTLSGEWANILHDYCGGCGFSEVYCHCLLDLDQTPCCEGCTHEPPAVRACGCRRPSTCKCEV